MTSPVWSSGSPSGGLPQFSDSSQPEMTVDASSVKPEVTQLPTQTPTVKTQTLPDDKAKSQTIDCMSPATVKKTRHNMVRRRPALTLQQLVAQFTKD